MQLDVAAAVARVSDAVPLLQDSCRHKGKTLLVCLKCQVWGSAQISWVCTSKQGVVLYHHQQYGMSQGLRSQLLSA
jgi:hypothetical protein